MMKEIKRDASDRVKIARKYKSSRMPEITPVEIMDEGECVIQAIKTDTYVEMVFEIREPLDTVFNTLCDLEQSSSSRIEEYHRVIL